MRYILVEDELNFDFKISSAVIESRKAVLSMRYMKEVRAYAIFANVFLLS